MEQTVGIPKTDHLFLLIGGNPLPNYVAAQLLLEEGGHLYLVHSQNDPLRTKSGTIEIAKRIYNVLIAELKKADRSDVKVTNISISETDPEDIYSKVKRHALEIRRPESVGLNYTGGTKVMAVHAHRALRDAAEEQRWQPVFSYLDAETLSLRVESGAMPPQSIAVRTLVPTRIETLVNLHNIVLKNDSPSRSVVLPDLAVIFSQLPNWQEDKGMNRDWRDWLMDEFCMKVSNNKCKSESWLPEEELRQTEVIWPHDWKKQTSPVGTYNNSLLEIQSKLQNYFEMTDTPYFHLGMALAQTKSEANLGSCRSLCEWLNGHWLEHYVLYSLEKIKNQHTALGVYDIGQSVDTNKKVGSQYDFEVDVAATLGYQFFAISCTTSTIYERNKNKWFQAYIRGRQLGGEEARVAFVTVMKKAKKFQKELEEQWQAAGKIQIFDARHISDLQTHLEKWLRNSARI